MPYLPVTMRAKGSSLRNGFFSVLFPVMLYNQTLRSFPLL